MLHNVSLNNFLTFSEDSPDLELQKLNVFLGRIGGGKSSFIDAIDLLRCAPDGQAFKKVIQRLKDPSDWLYKGKDGVKPATLDYVLHNPDEATNAKYPELGYSLTLIAEGLELAISNEILVGIADEENFVFYDSNGGNPLVRCDNELVEAGEDKPGPGQTCLSHYTDPKRYPVITSLARELAKTKIYRNWSFGYDSAIRQAAPTDLPSDCLLEDFTNLPLVLDNLVAAGLKPVILEHLQHFYVDAADFFVQRKNGKAKIFLQERPLGSPVSHLSDGIFRFLAVLCILLNPDQPPILCLEQPELGFHTQIMHMIGRTMKKATESVTQEFAMIVTTYSTELVDSLTPTPDDVLVCDKFGNGTQFERLYRNKILLNGENSLDSLWINNSFGGNLWAY
ncbi:MAG: AAA family ATPase [Clostridiales bacterium]|jgi:predicted ATPase|nr:AAA family ATPase [Clostridiales bacterium]